MTTAEQQDIQVTEEEKIDAENSIDCGDSGIQRDEDLDNEDEIISNNAEDQILEKNDVPESTEDNERVSTEKFTSSPDKGVEITTDPIEEDNTMNDPPTEDKLEEDIVTEEKNNESKYNNNVVTVELAVNENEKDSPEIVVEPKFFLDHKRHSREKLTPPSSRELTPRYYSKPPEGKAPPSLQITKERTFCDTFKRCVLLIIFTAIVGGYAIGGAYLFSHLERKREIEYNAKIDKWKNDTAILLATELRQVTPHEEIWSRKVFHYLEIYERDLLKASAVGYRRQDDEDREQRWTWTSSLFFSVALMTTTGYGPMTPRSKLGRIAALFYSLFGIPLAFSWFIVIGYTLATFWASLFHNLCCRLCHGEDMKELYPIPKEKASPKLPRIRSNSIVPVGAQKLIVRLENHSAKIRHSMLPETYQDDQTRKSSNHQRKSMAGIVRSMRQREIEFAELQNVYHKIDYVMAIIYACLVFVVYYVFFSIVFSIHQGWILTDVLYFSYLMFATVGPGCHELEDDGAEIKLKNDIFYTIHLCIGYCILAMIFNLIYLLVRRKCEPENLKNCEVFDSLHHEKF